MRKLILKMSVSLDGFVGGPNGEIDWIFRSTDDTAAAWTVDNIWQAGIHIMGSRTWQDMAAWWPYSNEPFAPPMNEIPKAVFTKNATALRAEELTTTALKNASANNKGRITDPAIIARNVASWADTYVATGDLTEEIMRMKQQPGKDILAHGGASFARSLISLGLVDEYKLLIYPIALGKGLPLFAALPKPMDLKLIEARSFQKGVVAHIYSSTSSPNAAGI
jgi:dihydrofolate reductase